MKKLLALLLVLPLTLPFWVSAQIFNQSQIIVAPYGGPAWLVSTSTNGSRKLDASTSPYFGTFTFGQATGSQATTTSLGLLGTKGCNTSSALTTNSSGAVICGAISGSGTVPGGSDTQVQFNDGGTTFGGNTNLTFQKLTGLLTGLSSLFTFSTTTNFLATGSSTLQNFTFVNATGSSATTTNFFSTTASSSKLFAANIQGAGLGTCNGSTNGLSWTAGLFGCTTITPAASSITGGAALTKTDDTNVTLTLGGSPSTALLGATSLTLGWTGTLADSRVADNLTISGGVIDNSIIGGTTAAAGTFTNILATGSSTLQNFTGLNSTTTNATSTTLFTTTASTTNFYGAGLFTCNSASNALTYNGSGRFGCNSISSSGGSGNVATSSAETAGQVPYWTTTAGTPAKLGSVATSSLVQSTGINIANGTTAYVIGAQPTFTIDQAFSPHWTGTHIFDLISLSTTTSATSTNFFSTTASTSNLFMAKIAGAGLSSCSGASNALTYISASSLFGCNSISAGSGTVNSGTTNQLAYYTGATAVSSSGFITENDSANYLGIGTTTPQWLLQLATSTRSQLTLTDNVANTHYSFRVSGNTLYLATSSPTTFATSSSPALSIDATQPAQGGIGTSSPWALFSLQTNQSPYAAGVLANPFTTLLAIASSTATATTTLFAINNTGQILATSTSPTLSSCGTGPTMGAGASNSHGRITAGATATGCTITFANAYSSVPACIIENETGSITNTFSYTVTASAITVTETALGGDIMDYMCMGNSL